MVYKYVDKIVQSQKGSSLNDVVKNGVASTSSSSLDVTFIVILLKIMMCLIKLIRIVM